MSLSLRALLFDLDDTLLVDEAVSEEALRNVAVRAAAAHHLDAPRLIEKAVVAAKKLWSEGACYPFCRSIGISAIECLWGNFLGETPELRALRAWALAYREAVFHDALIEQQRELHDLEKIAKQLASDFAEERRRCQRVFPEARALLEKLSQRYRLGLLTNGAPDLQREKIETSGLKKFFSSIIISGEHGIGKPEPALFERALKELSVKHEEALMIGNSLERDIAGACAAGIKSVWIDLPGSQKIKSEAKPDFTITDLSQLMEILSKEN